MMNDRYLMHHGVKGMKWGVRKDPQRMAKYRGAVRRYEYIRDARDMREVDPRLKESLYIARKGNKYDYVSKNYFNSNKAKYDEFINPYTKTALRDALREVESIEKGKKFIYKS